MKHETDAQRNTRRRKEELQRRERDLLSVLGTKAGRLFLAEQFDKAGLMRPCFKSNMTALALAHQTGMREAVLTIYNECKRLAPELLMKAEHELERDRQL